MYMCSVPGGAGTHGWQGGGRDPLLEGDGSDGDHLLQVGQVSGVCGNPGGQGTRGCQPLLEGLQTRRHMACVHVLYCSLKLCQ